VESEKEIDEYVKTNKKKLQMSLLTL